MAVILLGFSVFWFLSHQRQSRLSLIEWVVGASRQTQDQLERLGRKAEAETFARIADALSSGCGLIAHKVPLDSSTKREIERATMKASGDDYLNRIGVIEGAANHLPTKNALYWLGAKVGTKR